MRRKEKGGTDLMEFCTQSALARGTENVIFRYQGGQKRRLWKGCVQPVDKCAASR